MRKNRTKRCRAHIAATLYLLMPVLAAAESVDLSRYVYRAPAGEHVSTTQTFVATAGAATLVVQGEAAALEIHLNGRKVSPGEVALSANNDIKVTGQAPTDLRIRVRQTAEVALDVLNRIHFNTNVSNFEASRAFYGTLGFETLSTFPDANTVAMARAIGIEEPTSYDGSQGGEPGGYLLHGELIGLGFNAGVIDLIEFTTPRNDEPPYPALNRLGITWAVFETANLDADYNTLSGKGVRFLSAPVTRSDGTRFAMLKDPDGTFYELRQVDAETDEDAATHLHRIGAVNINVSDLERSLNWYRMLGFEPGSEYSSAEGLEVAQAMGFDTPVQWRSVVLTQKNDGSEIQLTEWIRPYDPTPPFPTPINHLGIHRMAFTSGDIEGDVEQLVAQGVEMISPITPCCSGPDAWGSIVAFYDPDGAIMELADMPYMTWFIRLMNLFN